MDLKEEIEVFYDCPEICSINDYDDVYAKEKASVLWLLSKAFGGEIPGDILEPFYRDQDQVRRLKPKIVHLLANAELYCLALVNIYGDPNYTNLDHQGIMQVLNRKGIHLAESRELALTETTLVQTAPIRMSAHMAIVDGILTMYIKEVLIPEKIIEVVRKFITLDPSSSLPSNSEDAAVFWINMCCKALEQELRSECSAEDVSKLPQIPLLEDISGICDGCCIAAVISYYCPNYFKWQDIRWNNPISLGDSIYNLQQVKRFCSNYLPKEIVFLTLEDFLYFQPSIKENVLAFIADLLFMFVIFKASCVTPRQGVAVPESSHLPLETSKSLSSFQSHKNQVPCSPIPNLRSDSYGGSTSSLPDIRPGSRARTYGSKERLCEKTPVKKSSFPSEETGPNELQRTCSVGMVNGWKAANLPHVSSTDSVGFLNRNANAELIRLPAEGESSSSHQSHPSIYSADDNAVHKSLSHSSRTVLCSQGSPLKDATSFGLRKSSESNLPGYRLIGDLRAQNGLKDQRRSRKSLEEYYSQLAGTDGPLRSVSATNITVSDHHKSSGHRGESVPESASSQSSGICLSDVDVKNTFSTTSFAQLSKSRDTSSTSINIVYHEREALERDRMSSNTVVKRVEGDQKKTTFAALPNTTTWQKQHAASSGIPQTDSGHETPTEPMDHLLNTQLCNIKIKLEDKKRKIELKKKRMEMLWKKQRQKLGKAAFLQAVSKGASSEAGTPDSGTGKEVGEVDSAARETAVCQSPSLVRHMSMQEIAADLDNVQKKWLNHTDISEQISITDATTEPNVEFGVDVENEAVNIDLQTSIEHLNTSLTDLQADISRITLQQEQVENFMKDSIDDCSHFFLHGPDDTANESLPLRTTTEWHYDGAAHSNRRGIYIPSSEEHLLMRKMSEFDAAPFTSLPPGQVNIPFKEELYSKVVKPESRQRQVFVTSPVRHQILPDALKLSEAKRTPKPKSCEVHVVLPQVPDSARLERRPNEDKQGFYVPLEKEVKRGKALLQKTGKGAPCDVPNLVPGKHVQRNKKEDANSLGFVIGADLVHPDPEAETEMARKKEMIMNMSIQRKAEYERRRAQNEKEYERIKEEERKKQESLERKREEEKRRREEILEQYRLRKLQEEIEKENSSLPKETIGRFSAKPRSRRETKPRPRSAYVHMNSDLSTLLSLDSAANKRNSQILTGQHIQDFDLDSLNSASTTQSSRDRHKSPNNGFLSHKNSNLFPEGSAPSSDGASDTASNGSAAADYMGPKLFVKPTAKSNRGIIINAINTVLAGAVNADTKNKVLEEINRSESKHFLILFRDAGCQFRALYTYNPEREEVTKLFGIGPKNVVDKMMDRFYKYNSGGKSFSEIQTKHLTVTIDAFTIPNSLWAGKKMIPPKKEFF